MMIVVVVSPFNATTLATITVDKVTFKGSPFAFLMKNSATGSNKPTFSIKSKNRMEKSIVIPGDITPQDIFPVSGFCLKKIQSLIQPNKSIRLSPFTITAMTPKISGTRVRAVNTDNFFFESNTINVTIIAKAKKVSIILLQCISHIIE